MFLTAKLLGEEILPLGHVRRDSFRRKSHSPWRGPAHEVTESRSVSPEYKTTCLSRPSRSPSPKASPPKIQDNYYGTTQLERRSRSPSPSPSREHAIAMQRLQWIPPLPPPPPQGRERRRLPSLPGQPPPPPAPAHHPLLDLSLDDIAFTTDSPTSREPGHEATVPPTQVAGPTIFEYDQRSRSPSPTTSAYSLTAAGSTFRRPRLRRLPATVRPPMMAPFLLTQDTVTGVVEQVPLPTVNHSPTIPHPEQRSPNGINFPRVCGSPTHQ